MSRYFRDIATRALGLAQILSSTAFFFRDEPDTPDAEEFVEDDSETGRPGDRIVERQIERDHIIKSESERVEIQRTHSESHLQTEATTNLEREVVNREPGETVIRETAPGPEVRHRETLRELLREANRETVERIHIQTQRLERLSRETQTQIERTAEREIRHADRIERLRTEVRAEMEAATIPAPAPESVVNISIGRIEVRSNAPSSRTTPASEPAPKRAISLDDYLRERSGGNR
ncbi:MAG: hypothetical protein GC165_06800 [Armatimonadetes bacterium]|nr:hypothetical protein [Armatimonadota bacterium]